ncbi:MAG: ArsR/SmtB family transcription factor [Candidatus Cyclobacteriaceae bacterium M2_1C_046]
MSTCIRVFADAEQIRQCKNELENNKKAISSISNVLNLTGNEVRFKILFLLNKEKELCPCDISDILNMSVPAVSQHLRKLKDGGVVVSRKVGQTIFYSLHAAQTSVLDPLFTLVSNNDIKTNQE